MVLVSNISALSVVLCAAAAGASAQAVAPIAPPHLGLRQVLPVSTTTPAVPGAAVPSSTTLGAVAPTTTTPTVPGVATEETTPTTPPVAGAIVSSKTTVVGAEGATTTAKTSKSSTTVAPVVPTTSSTTAAGGANGAAAGGAGGAPTMAVAPADVYTAAAGTGGILEYADCLKFEQKCLDLCEFGLYNMNCISGGLCLCYRTDPMATTTEETTVAEVTAKNAAMKRKWNGVLVAVQVLAVVAVTSAFM